MKKGQTTRIMVATVLGVLFLVSLLFLAWTYKDRIVDSASDQECVTSVRTNAKLKFGVTSFASEINCPTNLVPVNKRLDDNEVKKLIADRMKTCWFKFGNGDLALFEDKTGQHNFCAFCDILEFDEVREIKGMNVYLMENKIGRDGAFYWDYLYPNSKVSEITNTELFLSVMSPIMLASSLDISSKTARFDALKQELVQRDAGLHTNNDVAIVFMQGKYTSGWFFFGADRWVRSLFGLETIIDNSAVYAVDYTASEIENFECTSFPLDQLKYVKT